MTPKSTSVVHEQGCAGIPCESGIISQKSTTTLRWFETYDKVTRLGRFLVEEGLDAAELQHYYEKPWNWTDEWNEMLEREENK